METNAKKKAPSAKKGAAAAKNGPVKTLIVEDCLASIFARQREYKGQTLTFYSVSLSRSYRDASGQYRYVKTFDRDDLPKLQKLSQQCTEYLQSLDQKA